METADRNHLAFESMSFWKVRVVFPVGWVRKLSFDIRSIPESFNSIAQTIASSLQTSSTGEAVGQRSASHAGMLRQTDAPLPSPYASGRREYKVASSMRSPAICHKVLIPVPVLTRSTGFDFLLKSSA